MKTANIKIIDSIVNWMNLNYFSVYHIRNKSLPCHIMGNTKDGLAVYVHVSAKDKRHTITYDSYKFLSDKINTSCYAVSADSLEFVTQSYEVWLDNKERQQHRFGHRYLTGILPDRTSTK